MTDYYAEEKRLLKLRIANAERYDKLAQAKYQADLQASMGSNAVVLTDHSNDLSNLLDANLVSQQNEVSYDFYENQNIARTNLE